MPNFLVRRPPQFRGGPTTFAGGGRFQKEMVVPWYAFGASSTGGSTVAGNSGSNTDPITVGGSFPALGFRDTGSACAVWATSVLPLDADTSGSVTLYADWLFSTVGGSCAAIGACVFYLTGGSVISDAGAFAGSGLVAASAVNSTACVVTTSSFAKINSFSASTGGAVVVKFWRDAVSGSDDSGSEFGLLNVRLRYLANTLGPSSTE